MTTTSARPLSDRIEVRAPRFAAYGVRIALRLPKLLRTRILGNAFDRAERAFNPGDVDAILAIWADDVEYVPPPALYSGPPLQGRPAIQRFWEEVFARFDASTITNLALEEASPRRLVRTASLTHRSPDLNLDYMIRQTTEVYRGRVIRQVNEEI
jgi:hypothetical protein